MKVDLVCNSYKGFDVSTDFVFKQITYNYMWSNMNADGNAQQKPSSKCFWLLDSTNTTARTDQDNFRNQL
jgi:hypothetical protein